MPSTRNRFYIQIHFLPMKGGGMITHANTKHKKDDVAILNLTKQNVR